MQYSVSVIVDGPFLRDAPHLVELAIRAPGFGIEAGGSGHGLDVAMRAEIERVGLFGRFTPPAAVIALNGRRLICRRLFGRLDRSWSGER